MVAYFEPLALRGNLVILRLLELSVLELLEAQDRRTITGEQMIVLVMLRPQSTTY